MAKKHKYTARTGRVSSGGSEASVGLKISRAQVPSLDEFDALVTGAQLDTKITRKHPNAQGDAAGQATMGDPEPGIVVAAIATCGGSRQNLEDVSLALSMPQDDDLVHCANSEITVELKRTGDAPKKEAKPGADAEEVEPPEDED